MSNSEDIEYLTQEMIQQSKKRRLSDEKGKKKKFDQLWYKRRILRFDVDPFDYSNSLLVELGIEMFRYYNILNVFSIDEDSLRNFLNAVRRLYNPDNYFHNFNHVWTVMHTTFHVLLMGADQYLETLDIFAALVSAVCHDIGHPGNNNDFELATRSKLSEVYALPAEKNVLECYHASLTHTLLVSTDHDILRGLSESEKHQFKEIVSRVILGTDMALHTEISTSLRDIVQGAVRVRDQYVSVHGVSTRSRRQHPCGDGNTDTGASRATTSSQQQQVAHSGASTRQRAHSSSSSSNSSSSSGGKSPRARTPSATTDSNGSTTPADGGEFEPMSETSRWNFVRAVVHCADIGAQTQIFPIAKKWMERMYNEFNHQAEKETAMGIRTSTFIHSCAIDIKKYESQVFFIETFVEPVWKSLSAMVPMLNDDYRQLLANKAVYKRHLLKAANNAGVC